MLNELKKLNQWTCALSYWDKSPRRPDGKRASCTDPSTWSSYEECKNSALPHVGFMLTEADPYTIIDLDRPKNELQKERHRKIVEMADSYTELSLSGSGVHIIVEGTMPYNCRRDQVEVYTDQRFMIITFDAVDSKPVAKRQELLDILSAEMFRNTDVTLEDRPQEISDALVLRRAKEALNGPKFLELCEGNWQHEYDSQSEADHALLNIIAFHSPNNEQVRRIFRRTKLGARKKAQRDNYLNYSLKKIRADELPSEAMQLMMDALRG